MTNFNNTHRSWEASWINGPPDDPRGRWKDQLESMSDEELLGFGELSDTYGLRSVADDPDWQAEIESRGLELS